VGEIGRELLQTFYNGKKLHKLAIEENVIAQVDIYLPDCPPRPETLFDALIKLRKKIANESMQERSQLYQTHRYYTIAHQLRLVQPILTGNLLRTGNHEQPPAELATAMGTLVPPALLVSSHRQLELDRSR
jgi:NAD(P)H-quinone oxidoreductase subunit K